MLLTLEEAIARSETNSLFRDESCTYHGQIADWLIELKKLREENARLQNMVNWLADQCAICADAASEAFVCNDGDCGIEKCKFGNSFYFKEAARQAATEET